MRQPYLTGKKSCHVFSAKLNEILEADKTFPAEFNTFIFLSEVLKASFARALSPWSNSVVICLLDGTPNLDTFMNPTL